MVKKTISILLVLIMLLCFAACKDEPDTTVPNDGVIYSSAGVFPIVEEPVELTVWAILSSDITDYSTNYQSQWYEEYSGVKINWINVPSSGWADAFQNSVMSGQYPDIYLYDFATNEVEICAEYGAVIPLNDLIKEHCPNVKAILDKNQELKKSLTAKDGNIYTLFTESYDISAYKQKLWVNADWLHQYTEATGKGIPETTEEFKELLLFFKNNDMNGNGDNTDEIPFMGVNGVDGMYNLFGSFIQSCSASEGYGCYTDENGEMQFSFNTDAFRDALKYINELYEAGCISDQSFTISAKDRYKYTSGKPEDVTVGVAVGVSAADVVQLSEEGALDYADYVSIPPLEGPNGVRSIVTGAGEKTVALKNAITSTCKYPEIAAKWLDYWYSEEGRLWGINGGLENEHWTYSDGESADGKGQIVVHSVEAQSENFCWSGKGVNYALTEEDLGHLDMNELATNNYLATYMANLEYRPYAIKSNWPAIVWGGAEYEDVAIECSELIKLIKDEVTKAYSAFILGNKDIDNDADWNAYVEKLDEIGLDRYLELVELYISLGAE